MIGLLLVVPRDSLCGVLTTLARIIENGLIPHDYSSQL